jgi:hypothetical protein
MAFDTKRIASHCLTVFAIALVMFFIATALTYVEDGLKALDRPKWLQHGVAAISMGLFILDGVLIVGMAGAATVQLLVSMWSKENHDD